MCPPLRLNGDLNRPRRIYHYKLSVFLLKFRWIRYRYITSFFHHKMKSGRNQTFKCILLVLPFLLSFIIIFKRHHSFSYSANHHSKLSTTESHNLASAFNSMLQPLSELPIFSTSAEIVKTVADIPGASINHTGSISNPCLTKSSLAKMAFTQEPISPFSAAGMHSFILRSAYRLGPDLFVALGLSPLRLHDQKNNNLRKCLWVGKDKNVRMDGILYPYWPGEHHDLMFESLLLKCILFHPTPFRGGGYLFLQIDGEEAMVYEEDVGSDNLETLPEPVHSVSVCSFPLYRDINPRAVMQWMQYLYHNMNVDFFLLNDGGGVDEEMIKVLSPFLQAGVLSVNDMRAEYRYESKHHVLTANDCLYSLRFLTQWLLVLDVDEYLHVQPTNTLPSLLKQHENAPYITFGSLWWSVDLCRSELADSDWLIEKMTFHWPHTYCVGSDHSYPADKCLNYFGHRKYVLNPRKVWMVENHRPIEPIDGGIDLSTDVARINHFQGLVRNSLAMCSSIVSEKLEWWVEDDHLSKLASNAKSHGLGYRIWWKCMISSILPWQ